MWKILYKVNIGAIYTDFPKLHRYRLLQTITYLPTYIFAQREGEIQTEIKEKLKTKLYKKWWNEEEREHSEMYK